ncbi:MAG: quinolinate synthase NadA [Kiritimatiellaeota bacterium]|nr:quinolinate synthase NadA [Kiritimatiellota bacterium]
MKELLNDILRLKRERNAVILSHTYQPPEIQDLADFVGDSYGLSRRATQVEAAVIVFCGVRFMAETAAVLNPDRTVLLPAPDAGCPMADMITPEQLRELKAAHAGAPVVAYVNTTADVKAECTVCCTSSNAVRIVKSLGDVPEIIFVPDRYLGMFVERRLGRKMVLWDGFCPTHAMVRRETVERLRQEHPDAEVMVHPECIPEVQDAADHILSTGQMLELVRSTTCREFIVGTEEGILHTLRKAAPHITYHRLSPFLRCPNMKKISLEKIRKALETGEPRIVVPPEIAAAARRTIEAMIRITES